MNSSSINLSNASNNLELNSSSHSVSDSFKKVGIIALKVCVLAATVLSTCAAAFYLGRYGFMTAAEGATRWNFLKGLPIVTASLGLAVGAVIAPFSSIPAREGIKIKYNNPSYMFKKRWDDLGDIKMFLINQFTISGGCALIGGVAGLSRALIYVINPFRQW